MNGILPFLAAMSMSVAKPRPLDAPACAISESRRRATSPVCAPRRGWPPPFEMLSAIRPE